MCLWWTNKGREKNISYTWLLFISWGFMGSVDIFQRVKNHLQKMHPKKSPGEFPRAAGSSGLPCALKVRSELRQEAASGGSGLDCLEDSTEISPGSSERSCKTKHQGASHHGKRAFWRETGANAFILAMPCFCQVEHARKLQVWAEAAETFLELWRHKEF